MDEKQKQEIDAYVRRILDGATPSIVFKIHEGLLINVIDRLKHESDTTPILENRSGLVASYGIVLKQLESIRDAYQG